MNLTVDRRANENAATGCERKSQVNHYEALFVINTGGKDDAAPDLIEALKKELETAGAKVKAIQKMDKRTFARATKKQSAGYYVNFVFDAPPAAIAPLRAKLTLNETVFRVMFLEAVEKKAETKEPAAA
jgi:small subunit ribosomal protein S6